MLADVADSVEQRRRAEAGAAAGVRPGHDDQHSAVGPQEGRKRRRKRRSATVKAAQFGRGDAVAIRRGDDARPQQTDRAVLPRWIAVP